MKTIRLPFFASLPRGGYAGQVPRGASLILAILVLTTAACGADRLIQLTEADNGRTNSVNAGSEIKIVLEGNPTTGYSWEVASFSTNGLQQIGAVVYLQSEQSGEKHRVGVGGKFIFRFKAIGPGPGQIKLLYRRPWETTAVDKNYCVIFEIK